jgi:hypothetical protein
MKPRVSVILPAFLGYESVTAALEAWDAQTYRDQLELIVLCPSKPVDGVLSQHVVMETGEKLLNEARAAAARVATADFIMFAEDHCLPDPDCMEWIIKRLDEGWDAVGPALRPGDPGLISHGAFLISYAQWMLPSSGPVAHLPGHNAVVRRQLVVHTGSELEDLLIASMFLMARLHASGARFFLEERARMRHFDSIEWNQTSEIFLVVGHACGAMRVRESSALTRMVYGILTPVTAARHFSRGLIQFARAGVRAGFSPLSVLTSAYFAGAWAVGETIGAWRDLDRVKPRLWISEIKPVAKERAARNT